MNKFSMIDINPDEKIFVKVQKIFNKNEVDTGKMIEVRVVVTRQDGSQVKIQIPGTKTSACQAIMNWVNRQWNVEVESSTDLSEPDAMVVMKSDLPKQQQQAKPEIETL
jgi:hypothetical protein